MLPFYVACGGGGGGWVSSALMPEFRPARVRAADIIQAGARRPDCATGDIHLGCTLPLEAAGEVDLLGTDCFSS